MADKHIWLSKDAEEALRGLALRWNLSHSATIAKALELAKSSD